jgi:predicted nucleic acid-binding protein
MGLIPSIRNGSIEMLILQGRNQRGTSNNEGLFRYLVLVPALVGQLSNHESSFAEFLSYTSGGNRGFCSTHSLAETCSVLTSLPLPRRSSTIEARMLIEESILKRLGVVELDGKDYLSAIELVSGKGLASGIIHDALHVKAAGKASCSRIYTCTINHFKALVPEGIVVSSP